MNVCIYKYISHSQIDTIIKSQHHRKLLYNKYPQSHFQLFFFFLRDNSYRKAAIYIPSCVSELNPHSHILFSDELCKKCPYIKGKTMQIKSKLSGRCFLCIHVVFGGYFPLWQESEHWIQSHNRVCKTRGVTFRFYLKPLLCRFPISLCS